MDQRSNGEKSDSTLPKESATEDGSDNGWVTLREASSETGISVSTLRNWYRKGLVNSRVEKGPNGAQRLVMLSEVAERVASKGSPGSAPEPLETPPRTEVAGQSLPDLIQELAAARERAGRAEARAELLEQQLNGLRAKGGESVTGETLKAENSVLRERVEFLRDQTEELKRRLIVAELDDINAGSSDGEPLVPPEEEDEFLAMTQRWRARRKRRRFARRQARAAKKLRTS